MRIYKDNDYEYQPRSPLPKSTPEAMAYVPFQQSSNSDKTAEEALDAGTLFNELDKPFMGMRINELNGKSGNFSRNENMRSSKGEAENDMGYNNGQEMEQDMGYDMRSKARQEMNNDMYQDKNYLMNDASALAKDEKDNYSQYSMDMGRWRYDEEKNRGYKL